MWSRTVTSDYSSRMQEDPEARFTAADLQPLVSRLSDFVRAQSRLESQLRLLGAEAPGAAFLALPAMVPEAASPPAAAPLGEYAFAAFGAPAVSPVRLVAPQNKTYSIPPPEGASPFE